MAQTSIVVGVRRFILAQTDIAIRAANEDGSPWKDSRRYRGTVLVHIFTSTQPFSC